MRPCVYILASGHHGTLYTGVTSNIGARLTVHHDCANPDSFTARYNVDRLVWREFHDSMERAIQREKSLKRWRRAWKIDLIEATNPHWHPLDLETGEPLPEELHGSIWRSEWLDRPRKQE